MTRLAIVTGGAQGLGRAIVERLAHDGNQVVIADIQLEAARRTAADLSATVALVTALAVDVGNEHSVAELYAEIDRRFGRLDILVNNAGIGGTRIPIEQTTLAMWEHVLKINLTGPLLMCQKAVPLMRRGGSGRIVNISSRAARARTAPNIGAYAASKTALIGLSQVLAGEVGSDGITVNCVAPTSVDTGMTRAISGVLPDYFERAAKSTAVGRLGVPGDIAEAVAFLCSAEASFITGTVVDVNGGSSMV